ncbi:hypothetical protein Gpo141_00010784 [Globisporangium polare]
MEARGTSVKNVCPLRNNVVPKHVLVDTTSLLNLIETEPVEGHLDGATLYSLACLASCRHVGSGCGSARRECIDLLAFIIFAAVSVVFAGTSASTHPPDALFWCSTSSSCTRELL